MPHTVQLHDTKGLTDKQLRTLAQASKRQGLRDEASYLRLLLEEARAEERRDDVLKIMLALARVEEADSRISMRSNRYPDEEGGSQLFQLTRYMFGRLTALFPAAVPSIDVPSIDGGAVADSSSLLQEIEDEPAFG